MSNIQTAVTSSIAQSEAASLFTTLVLNSDLSKLSDPQRVEYYKIVCERAGLDPMAKPFDLLMLNGKMVLYANKTTTAQLTSNHRLTVSIVSKEVIGNILCVTARATKPNGASTEDVGAVNVANLQGDAAANAHMKAITKAKRRAVLSVCGLGMLDETETDTMPAGVVERVELPLQLTEEIKTSKLSDEESATADMWKDTIEGAENSVDLYNIVLQIKNAPQAVKDVVGPILKARADSLNLVWSGGKYVERIR